MKLTRKGYELFFDRLKARETLIESRKSHTVAVCVRMPIHTPDCPRGQPTMTPTKTEECPKTKKTNEK